MVYESKTEFVLQNNYTGNWQDFMSANKPDDLVIYADQRKKAVPKLKQRVIERITTVEEKIYVTI